MSVVHVDVRELSGLPENYTPEDGQVWFSPFRAYVVDDGTDDYLVSSEILKTRLVDGVADPDLPETPVDNLMKVQLRGIRGYGAPWYVQIPAGDCNLFELEHIDPDTMDPEVPPSPAWLSALAAEVTARADADTAIANALNAYSIANNAAVAAKLPLAGGTLADPADIALGTTTGTKIGTATTQKLGFYNTTPVVQPGGTVDIPKVLADLGLRANVPTFAARRGYTTSTTTPFTHSSVTAEHIDMDATAGAKVVNLLATTSTGYTVTIKKTDATANTVTINPPASGNIDGATSLVLTNQYDWVTVMTTGVSGTLRVIGGNIQYSGVRLAQAKSVSGVFNIPGNGGVGVITTIPNTSISVPNSNGRPVTLKYRATGFQTIVGTGSLYLMLYETTGAATLITSHANVLPNSLASGLFVVTFPVDEFDIGVVTTTRTFELRGQIYTTSGSPSASFLNGATGPTVLKAITE